MSEYIKLEINIKDYQKQLEEKEQLLNQINKLQQKRKKVEDILKVVNEEKEKIKEEGDNSFFENIKHKKQNEDCQKELEERKELEHYYNLKITEKKNIINKLNNILVEKQKELELEKKEMINLKSEI
jgi:uncharacterized coiled-coil protein SlyX